MSDLSRVEQLLRNVLGEDIYEVTPQSRVEALLVELNELIEGMDGSVSPEDIATAVAAYLDEHLTNPTNPPVDTSLSISGAAADAKKTGDELSDLKEGFTQMTTATAPDVGKALKVKTVADGKVTGWEFGETGVAVDPTLTIEGKAADAKATGDRLEAVENTTTGYEYNDDDEVTYSLVNTSSLSSDIYFSTCAPNVIVPYRVKSLTAYGTDGEEVKLSLWSFSLFSDENYWKFTKIKDVATGTFANGLYTFNLNMMLIEEGQILFVTTASKALKYGSWIDSQYCAWSVDPSYATLGSAEVGTIKYKSFSRSGYSGACSIDYVLASNCTPTTIKTTKLLSDINTSLNSGTIYDDALDESSSKAVRNSVLTAKFNTLDDGLTIENSTVVNDAETEYVSTNKRSVRYQDLQWAYAYSLDVPTYDTYTVNKVVVRALTGASVKLGLWQYRTVTTSQGYYTLIQDLGTYEASDNRIIAEFSTPVTVDSSKQVIFAVCAEKKLGFAYTDSAPGPYKYARKMQSVKGYTNGDIMSDVAVGSECSTILSKLQPYNGWNDSWQTVAFAGAYEVTYTPTVSETIVESDSVKNIVTDAVYGDTRYGSLYGKVYYAAGDSITAGSVADADGVKRTYADYVANRNGMTLYKDAISGSRMSATSDLNGFSQERYLNCPEDADFITLWFGANDGNNVGTIDDTDNSTFCGGYNKVLTYYINNRPKAKIGIVVTPTASSTMKDAIRALGKKYGVKVFDPDTDPTIPFWNCSYGYWVEYVDDTIKALRRSQWWVDSNLHPTPAGNEYISYPFEAWLRTL